MSNPSINVVAFFCQGDMKEDLLEITMFNRNKKLRTVLEKVKWPHLTVRYNSAIDARLQIPHIVLGEIC